MAPQNGTELVEGSPPKDQDESRIFSDLIQEEKAKHTNELTRSGGVATPDEIDRVVVKILTTKNLPLTLKNKASVKLCIAVLAQEGATSPKFSDARERFFGNILIKVKEIRVAALANNTTFRRLARGLRNLAIDAAREIQIDGNLSKAYRLDHPNANSQDLYWVSDFQTLTDNPSMPQEIHEWLLQNYANRFKKQTNK